MHLANNEYQKAVADYTKAISVNDRSATAYLGRSIAYEKLGDLEQSKADQERFSALSDF